MKTPGDATLALIEAGFAAGARHVVVLMRHSAREFAPGKHDLLNPLTDEGRVLSRSFGERLPGDLTVRGYASPAERCVETAELVLGGYAGAGGDVTRARPAEALGVFYALDQMRMFKAMQAAGGQVPFLESWYRRDVAPDVMIPAEHAARYVGAFAAGKLQDPVAERQLDVLVSHDMTLYTVRDQLLGQSAADFGEVGFLDGVILFDRAGEVFIQSEHGAAVSLSGLFS